MAPTDEKTRSFFPFTEKLLAIILSLLSIAGIVIGFRYRTPQLDAQNKQLEVERNKAETDKLRLELAGQSPRLEFLYVSISADLFAKMRRRRDQGRQQTADDSFLLFPVVPNAVAGADLSLLTKKLPTPESASGGMIICLVAQNLGKADARDVKIALDSVTLTQALNVPFGNGNESNYDARAKAAGSRLGSRTIELPQNIVTGSGVLVPLFISANGGGAQASTWYLSSRIAYLPQEVSYLDPISNTVTKLAVRRMKDPVKLANGIVGRG